jgi:uncharacterized protein
MLFIVQFIDVYADHPERLAEREQHMAAHLAYLAEHGEHIVAAGALRASAAEAPSGGIWILSVESESAAETLYKGDPFWRAGLRKSVSVSRWARAFWCPAFIDCMAAIGTGQASATAFSK